MTYDAFYVISDKIKNNVTKYELIGNSFFYFEIEQSLLLKRLQTFLMTDIINRPESDCFKFESKTG